MSHGLSKSPIALAVATALGAATMIAAPNAADANERLGQYVTGDFHNHTTCSDGSISMQKNVDKSIERAPWGLDWFVQAGHGGSGNRNCTLVEDETLATPAYPFRSGPTPFDVPTTNPVNPSPSQYMGPQTRWSQSIGNAAIKGNVGHGCESATCGAGSRSRSSSIRWSSTSPLCRTCRSSWASSRSSPGTSTRRCR